MSLWNIHGLGLTPPPRRGGRNPEGCDVGRANGLRVIGQATVASRPQTPLYFLWCFGNVVWGVFRPTYVG
jgi:hypothetical protein